MIRLRLVGASTERECRCRTGRTTRSADRCSFSSSTPSTNHYQTLGVGKAATRKEIKERFYELSRHVHPDSGSAEASANRFAEISEAYAVVGDSAARRRYDQTIATTASTAGRPFAYGSNSYHSPGRPQQPQHPGAGPFSGWRDQNGTSARSRPTHGYAWSGPMRGSGAGDEARNAFNRSNPFASPESGGDGQATWQVFQRMSAQDARRKRRQAGGPMTAAGPIADDSFVDGTLPYGGGSANRIKAEDSQFVRAGKLGAILLGSGVVISEVHKSVSPSRADPPPKPRRA